MTPIRNDRYPIPPIVGNSTARFGAILLLTIVIWAVVWPFFTLAFVNRYDSPGTAWIQGLYQRKELALARADSTGRGRLVIVGGSGTLLGVDAELIQAKLGVPTVNLGTHAGLNAYIFYRARIVLRPGDSVLLCPEYEFWNESYDDISNVEWSYVTTYDKRFLWSLGVRRALSILYSEPAENYVNAVYGWRSRLSGQYNKFRAGYNVAVMGPNGDLRLDVPHQEVQTFGRYPFADLEANPAGAEPIRDFATWARGQGIRVFYSWPNCCRPEPAPTDEASVPPVAMTSLLNNLGVVILNTPGETAYPREMFTDSVYHADGGCRRIRSEDLARRLRPYFGLPPAPAQIEGIFLVGGGVNRPRPGNEFADRPGVRAKYFTRTRLNHPDAVTAGDLEALASKGILIWHDDPTMGRFGSFAWHWERVDSDPSSLTFWLRKYNHHLFVIGFAGGGKMPLQEDLPLDIARALSGPGLAVAILGTGPLKNIQRFETGPKSVLIRTDLNGLAGSRVPNLSIIVGASAGEGTPWSRIRLDNRMYVVGLPGEVAVAVIDPDNGVMVDCATFKGDEAETFWSLRQLKRGDPDMAVHSFSDRAD